MLTIYALQSVLTLTDVEVTFSKEYYGPDSYIELSSDYPNTFNMYFDVLKAYPPTAIVKILLSSN